MPPEQIIAALMFAGMIAFLFFGFPVAFSLTFTGLFFGLLGVSLGYLQASFFDILPLRIWGTMTNFTLLAVPLFVFMGVALEKSGLAEELLETMALLFGKLKGGIAISVVVVGAILAASTGIVGASVITMGLMLLGGADEPATKTAAYTINFPEDEQMLKDLSRQLLKQAEADALNDVEPAAGTIAPATDAPK